MKRCICATSTHNTNTDFVEIEVNIDYSQDDIVEAASILDINDPEFFDFEGSLLAVLEMHDFDLEDAYQSDNPDSISQYYILTKTNSEGTRLRIFVKLRVSDHAVADRTYKGRTTSHKQRDLGYIHKEAAKFAQEKFNQKRGYRPRQIDVIFNDMPEHFQSYEEALRHIEDKLEEFDPEED